MPRKRVNLSDEDALLFDVLKEKEGVSNEEMWSLLISSYSNSKLKNEEQLNKLFKEIQIVKEYVMLLVKTDPNLPTRTEPDKMLDYVNSDSRFHKLIEKKIIDNEKKKL